MTTIHNEIIRITASDRNRLKAQARRTGLTPLKLIARMKANLPKGLTADIVKAWMNGKLLEADPVSVTAVIRAWESMPDREARMAEPHRRKAMSARNGRPRIPLIGEMRRQLLAEIARTDASYAMILEGAPKLLNERVIRTWESGQQASVDAELWGFVIERLASLPDK